jgi:capsular polysaccharide biosynthesis protein
LTAALPRLWHLRSAPTKRRRILCHGHETPAEWFARDFVRDILSAIGLTAEDFVRLERPSAIKRLWIPRPAMEEQNFIHRAFDDLARRIGRFYGVHRQARGDKKIYLSKTHLSSGITRFANEHVLESYLSDRGVTIAHPQELSFPDQLKLLAEADVICGTVGSAMHTSVFLDRPSRIVGLTGNNLVNANHALFDRLKGNDSIYLYPEVEATQLSEQDGFSSTWTLDIDAAAEEFAAQI